MNGFLQKTIIKTKTGTHDMLDHFFKNFIKNLLRKNSMDFFLI